MRLDRFLYHHARLGKREARARIAAGSVLVDQRVEYDTAHHVGPFTHVHLDGMALQQRTPIYLMLHKPAGILSATTDPQHPTVIDLIEENWKHELHIAGRLDRASTGLLLLTNDSQWSRGLTNPDEKVTKSYLVGLRDPLSADTQEIFRNGIYFAYEDLTTQPTELEIITPYQVRIGLQEGKYHQIKRMFHAVGNKVISLHRESIGHITLDPLLPQAAYRLLTPDER